MSGDGELADMGVRAAVSAEGLALAQLDAFLKRQRLPFRPCSRTSKMREELAS